MPAATSAPERLPNPQPAANGADAPSRTTRLLGFLHRLVDYGRELAHSLRQGLTVRELHPVALCFGTPDVMLILRRISDGLRIARMLRTRLETRIARTEDAPPRAKPAPPTAAQAEARRASRRARRAAARLGLPSARDIADDLGRRPTWVVVAEICRRLGIVPEHGEIWQEMLAIIDENGGRITRIFMGSFERLLELDLKPFGGRKADWSALRAMIGEEVATGPP
jgi:hypothetical protein